MLVKLNRLMNIMMGTFVGVFIGKSIYVYLDYRKHPKLYAAQSAPWYTSIEIYAFFTVALLLIAVLIKWIIKRNIKSNQTKADKLR